MRIKLAATCLSLALLVLHAPRAHAQGCEGKLANLMVYAGSYDTDALLNDPAVAAAIQELLGSERDHLFANIAVRGSVDLISCDLVLSGNADHMGGEEDGIVSINVYSGSAAAAIHTAGRIDVYVTGGDYMSAPISIKDWIAVMDSAYRYRFDPPQSARVLAPQGER